MIDKRVSDIIHFLKRNRKGSFPEIHSELGINQSQLKYSIKKLNEFLEDNNIEQIDGDQYTIVISDTQYQFLIRVNEADFVEQYILNSMERVKLIFLLLVAQDEEYISLAHFYDILNVGKTTVTQDIKELTNLLANEQIQLDYSRQSGYRLLGDELIIRQFLFKWIMADFANDDRILYKLYLSRFKQIELVDFIKEARCQCQSFGIQLVEDRFAEFCCFFALILNRLKNSKSDIKVDISFDFSLFKEYKFSKSLCENFGVFSEDEQIYISAWMLGQSVGNLKETTPDKDVILEIVHQIMRRFEKLSGIFFSDRNETINQLYGHLRPCYYRLLFKFPIANQLVSKIKKEYRDIYYLVGEAVKKNDKLQAQGISEDEIAYLTIHFASIIEKNGTKLNSVQVKAAVVCSNGIGSSAIIYEELQNLFPEIFFIGPLAIEEFEKLDYSDIDIIFSTTVERTILESENTVFIVRPIMTASEKYNLIRNVRERIGDYQLPDIDKMMQIIEKHTTVDHMTELKKELARYLTHNKKSYEPVSMLRLSDILRPEYIKKIPVGKDINDIIETVSYPLIEAGIINHRYVDSLKQEIQNPYNTFHIAPGVLLPHTEPSKGVSGLGITLGILEEPLLIDDRKIDYVFVLAAIDNKQHISAMADLVKLITNQEMVSIVRYTTSIEEIFSFIKRNEV